MKKYILLISFLGCLAGAYAQKTAFSEAALKESFTTKDNKTQTLKDILESYKGKKVFIEMWASWCKDCLVDIPNVTAIKSKYKNVAYLTLSLDKTFESWLDGLKKYNIDSDSYWIQNGWKGSPFCKDIALDWIPRYLVLDEKGAITLFKAVKADDKNLLAALDAKAK